MASSPSLSEMMPYATLMSHHALVKDHKGSKSHLPPPAGCPSSLVECSSSESVIGFLFKNTPTHFPEGADKRPDTLPHQVQRDLLPLLEGTLKGSFGTWEDIRNYAPVFTVRKPPADQAPCLAGWSDLAQQEAVSTHSLEG
ncbi:hypothetical protein LEMLEM_LOCUS20117 [Lemmus lemmus]